MVKRTTLAVILAATVSIGYMQAAELTGVQPDQTSSGNCIMQALAEITFKKVVYGLLGGGLVAWCLHKGYSLIKQGDDTPPVQPAPEDAAMDDMLTTEHRAIITDFAQVIASQDIEALRNFDLHDLPVALASPLQFVQTQLQDLHEYAQYYEDITPEFIAQVHEAYAANVRAALALDEQALSMSDA